MTTAYYSTVLDHPLETVWSRIRDFNNYPAYIDGVSESVIEDDRRGDFMGVTSALLSLGSSSLWNSHGNSGSKRWRWRRFRRETRY